MVNRFSPVQAHVVINDYQLKGKALKQWWQIADLFSLSLRHKTHEEERYQNVAIKAQLLFLLQLPFCMALQYHITGPQGIKMLLIAAGAWLIMCFTLFISFKQHCRKVLRVQLDENGLTLQSPLLKRNLKWLEIRDSFLNQNGDLELCCKENEYFLLSKDLTNSAELFQQIAARSTNSGSLYTYNYRFPDSLTDGAGIACLAIVLAVAMPILTWLLYRERALQTPVDAIVAASILIPGVLLYWKMHLTRVSELVRIGSSGFYVATRKNATQLSWSDVQSIKRLAGFVIVKSRKGWFMTLSQKKDPLADNLIESHKRTLLR